MAVQLQLLSRPSSRCIHRATTGLFPIVNRNAGPLLYSIKYQVSSIASANPSTISGENATKPTKEKPLANSPPIVIPAAPNGQPNVQKSNSSAEKLLETSQPGAAPPPPMKERPRPRLRAAKAAMTLTPNAVSRLRGLLLGPTPQYIRVGVRNKGCAGMSYHLEYVDKPGMFDETVEQDGVTVLIDSKALFSIIGSEMDWTEDRLREIACGKNAKPAQQIATVRPGDQLRWRWVTHSGDRRKPWTHNEGTHRSWIGSCNGDCSTTDPTTVQWVELTDKYTGQQTYDGTYWPVRVLASDQAWADTIPSAPNGDYLIRNELTALHYSTKPVGSPRENDHDWGTEFYPSCMAIRIQGSDGSYDMGMAVSFPGAYNINISGHYNPDLWANPNSVGIAVTNKYPRTAGTTNGVGGTNPNTNNGNSNNGPAPAPAPAPAPTASSSSTTTALEANAPVPSSRPNPICTRRKSKRGLEKANKKRRVLKRRSNAGGHAGHAH
ncbi:Iron-sulfur assembly protein 1 [Serendipita sp. 399]|nr:Iron-sulfur assembly protein 1 [Serendipita sp. 399]